MEKGTFFQKCATSFFFFTHSLNYFLNGYTEVNIIKHGHKCRNCILTREPENQYNSLGHIPHNSATQLYTNFPESLRSVNQKENCNYLKVYVCLLLAYILCLLNSFAMLPAINSYQFSSRDLKQAAAIFFLKITLFSYLSRNELA